MTVVYMAYSKHDIGSDYIDRFRNALLAEFGIDDDVRIIDPKDHQDRCLPETEHDAFKTNMFEVFFPLIEECDVFAWAPEESNNRMSSGVRYEFKFAKGIGKVICTYGVLE